MGHEACFAFSYSRGISSSPHLCSSFFHLNAKMKQMTNFIKSAAGNTGVLEPLEVACNRQCLAGSISGSLHASSISASKEASNVWQMVLFSTGAMS